MHSRPIGAVLGFSLLLAACGQGPSALPEGALTALEVTSALSPLQGASLGAQGVPTSQVKGELIVEGPDGEVLFDADHKPSAAGTRLVLTPETATAKLYLKANVTYAIKLKVKDTTTPNVLAYAQQLGVDPAAMKVVHLAPQALLGEVTLSLNSALTAAQAGDQVTAWLKVTSPGRSDLQVPESDFEVTYKVTGGQKVLRAGQPVESKLGVRVDVTGEAPELLVDATVTGLLPSYVPGAIQGTFRLPVQGTLVGADLTLPSVTLGGVGAVTVGQAMTLSGTAGDDRKLSKVEVYDGVAFLGSATLSPTVAGVDWQLSWVPQAASGTLTVLAYDGAGNVTRLTRAYGMTALPAASGVISAGQYHAAAVLPDGRVSAFGSNGSGQTDVPPGLSGVKAVSAGGAHTLALKEDGTVVAWGSNERGQATVPVGLRDVVAISAGDQHTLALKADGTVVAWGDSSDNKTAVPTGLSDVVAISAGVNHSLALRRDGTVVSWGENATHVFVPAGLTNVVAVSAGYRHSVALKADGTVVAWGDDPKNTTVPAGLTDVRAVSVSYWGTVALRGDGSVVAWGYEPTTPAGLANAVAVDAGRSYALAVRSDGSVFMWGGDGATPPADLVVRLP